MSKKIVYYKELWNHPHIGFPTFVIPINHPGPNVSNTTLVKTSSIIKLGKDGEFETENTIYKLEKYAPEIEDQLA